MRKTLMAIVAAISIFVATISTPTKVEARCYGCWGGAAVAAGLIGAMIARGAYGYGPEYGYVPAYYGYGYGYGVPGAYSYYPYHPAYYGYAPAYYAPRYYAPRYYAPRRYVGYAPYYRGYYAPRRAYAGRYYVRRRW